MPFLFARQWSVCSCQSKSLSTMRIAEDHLSLLADGRSDSTRTRSQFDVYDQHIGWPSSTLRSVRRNTFLSAVRSIFRSEQRMISHVHNGIPKRRSCRFVRPALFFSIIVEVLRPFFSLPIDESDGERHRNNRSIRRLPRIIRFVS